MATADTVAEQMAGPAMRAWHLAESLSLEHDVRLVSTNRCSVRHDRFEALEGNSEMIEALVDWCDIFVFQGYILWDHPSIAASTKVVVADVYDPMHLEQLEQARPLGEPHWGLFVIGGAAALNHQLARADYLICASEDQRMFWLGQLAAIGRIDPELYAEDPTYRSFIDVVPFGLADDPPVATKPAIRGVIDGIGPDDRVLLWNGGVYNWFDPDTLIRAVHALVGECPDLRLVFMGMRHPNPDVPDMRAAADAIALADELGLTDRHVFFNTEWVPFDQRQNFLLDADIGVSTHLAGIETDFAFRTRILDCLWAGLPVVATEGGALSALVADRDLGAVVPPRDVDALAAALRGLLGDADRMAACRANVGATAKEYRWSEVVQPLIEFCRHPRRAPDLLNRRTATDRRYELGTGFLMRNKALRLVVRRLYLLDQEGWRGLIRRGVRAGR